MLRTRLLSTFTVIGLILIALGIIGLIMGPRFVFDPGQPVTGKEAWCYLAIGILMVVNGMLTPAHPDEKQPTRTAARNGRKPALAPTEKARTREVTVTAADKNGETIPRP